MVAFVIAVTIPTFAQTAVMDSTSIAAINELTLLQMTDSAYYSQKFTLELISSVSGESDTLTLQCSMLGDNYKIVSDSTVQIQNDYVNLELYQDGKIMVLSRPIPFRERFLSTKFEESDFQKFNVASMQVLKSGSNNQIKFNFLPESEYDTYVITYSPSSNRVNNIYQRIKMTDNNGAFIPGEFNTININLLNYLYMQMDKSFFDPSPYIFFGAGNQPGKQAAFSDYELVNLMDTE